MAMKKSEESIIINAPASEIIADCRFKDSPLKKSEVTGYYTSDNICSKTEIISFFENFEKEFWIDSVKVKEYYDEAKKVKALYGEKYSNQMLTLDEYCGEFINAAVQIPALFFNEGTQRYLKFKNDNETCKKFREIIYEGLANIVIEKKDNKFMIYPKYKLDYLKKLKINSR